MTKVFLKYSKIVEIHPKPKKWLKYLQNLKITKNTLET